MTSYTPARVLLATRHVELGMPLAQVPLVYLGDDDEGPGRVFGYLPRGEGAWAWQVTGLGGLETAPDGERLADCVLVGPAGPGESVGFHGLTPADPVPPRPGLVMRAATRPSTWVLAGADDFARAGAPGHPSWLRVPDELPRQRCGRCNAIRPFPQHRPQWLPQRVGVTRRVCRLCGTGHEPELGLTSS